MVLARPDERETCPYHFSLRLWILDPDTPAGFWDGPPRW